MPSAEDNVIAAEEKAQLENVFGEPFDDLRSDDEKLRVKLLNAGLTPRKVKLIEARLVHCLTFKEIALEMGLASSQSASELFWREIKSLRTKWQKK